MVTSIEICYWLGFVGLSGVVRPRVRVLYSRDFVNVIELGSIVVSINRRFGIPPKQGLACIGVRHDISNYYTFVL